MCRSRNLVTLSPGLKRAQSDGEFGRRLQVSGRSRRYDPACNVRAARNHNSSIPLDGFLERRLKRVPAPVSRRAHGVDQPHLDRRLLRNRDGLLAVGELPEPARRLTVAGRLRVVVRPAVAGARQEQAQHHDPGGGKLYFRSHKESSPVQNRIFLANPFDPRCFANSSLSSGASV